MFHQWLTAPVNLNGTGTDTMLTQEELAEICSIKISSLGISSLEGIKVFYALEELSCKSNALTELNVQQNSALCYLQCDQNRLTHLDLRHNPTLAYGDGSGFVSKNNYLQTLILPGQPD